MTIIVLSVAKLRRFGKASSTLANLVAANESQADRAGNARFRQHGTPAFGLSEWQCFDCWLHTKVLLLCYRTYDWFFYVVNLTVRATNYHLNVESLQNIPYKSAFVYISYGAWSIFDSNYAGNQVLRFYVDHLSERLHATMLVTSKTNNFTW